MALNTFFIPFENNEFLIVDMFLQDSNKTTSLIGPVLAVPKKVVIKEFNCL